MCQSGGKGQFQGYVFLVGDKKAEVVEREKLYIGTAACGAAAADSAATAGDCVVTAACSEAAAESAALAIDSCMALGDDAGAGGAAVVLPLAVAAGGAATAGNCVGTAACGKAAADSAATAGGGECVMAMDNAGAGDAAVAYTVAADSVAPAGGAASAVLGSAMVATRGTVRSVTLIWSPPESAYCPGVDWRQHPHFSCMWVSRYGAVWWSDSISSYYVPVEIDPSKGGGEPYITFGTLFYQIRCLVAAVWIDDMAILEQVGINKLGRYKRRPGIFLDRVIVDKTNNCLTNFRINKVDRV